jgi:hypothetical protein
MQVATLDILVDRAHFDPQVARAIGEAIESEIRAHAPVTEPVLDKKIDGLRVDLESQRVGLDRKIDELYVGLDRKIDALRANLEQRMARLRGSIELTLAQLENRLVLKMAALGAAGVGILFALLRRF